MRLYVDTETAPVREGLKAPPLACVSACGDVGAAQLFGARPGVELVLEALDRETPIVGFNFGFDTCVLMANDRRTVGPILRAYEQGRVGDSMLRAVLQNIDQGRQVEEYSLEDQAALRGVKLEKGLGDKYGPLVGTDPATWEPRYQQYPKEDVVATRLVYQDQDKDARLFHDEPAQARAAFALQATSNWGLRVDKEAVKSLRLTLERESHALRTKLRAQRIVRPDGTRDMGVIASLIEATVENPVLTGKSKKVSTAAEVLETIPAAWCADLVRYAEVQGLLSKYIGYLSESSVVQSWFWPLLVTGRCSSRNPNVQQFPRDSAIDGDAAVRSVREVFIPRDGNVYVGCDYDTLELRTLAQVCLSVLGESKLADALRAGFDPHLWLAAILAGVEYDEALARYKAGDKKISDLRQMAKPANFGFPAGMSSRTFVTYAWRSYGVKLDLIQAERLREAWLQAWPEMARYWAFIKSVIHSTGGKIQHLGSKRWRGGLFFTSAANTFFQGMAADGAKAALFEVVRRCLSVPTSALYGCMVVNFIHDEIWLEAPEHRAHEAAQELSAVMCEEMSRFVTQIPIKASPVLMRRPYKGVKPVFANGRLVPYERKAA